MTFIFSKNGQLFQPGEGHVDCLDRAFLYGDAVFETIASIDGKPLNLDRHLDRLWQNASLMKIDLPWSKDEIRFELEHINSLMKDALKSKILPETYLKTATRLVVSRGTYEGLKTIPDRSPNRYTYCKPYYASDYINHCLKTMSKGSGSISDALKPKTPNYLEDILAIDSLSGKYTDIVWCDSEGMVSEGTTYNLFFIGRIGDELEIVTPKLNANVLPGTMRQLVINLLRKASIATHEIQVSKSELPRFDEAFLTSALRGIEPIHSIDQMKFHSSREKSTTNLITRLLDAFATQGVGRSICFRTAKWKNAGA